MGKAQGSLNFRDGDNPSAQCMANIGNTMRNLFIQAGMIQCTDAEYPGQAGTYVASTTPGSGETSSNVSSSSKTLGFHVFRHPVLNLYIKVNLIYTNVHSGGYGFAGVNYEIAMGISNGVLATPKTDYAPLSWWSGASDSHFGYRRNVALDTFVYCDEKSFWCYCGPLMLPNTANVSAPSGISHIGFAVIASESDNSQMIMLGTPPNINNGNVTGIASGSLSRTEGGSSRYWYLNTASQSITYLGSIESIAGLQAPSLSTTELGVRVAQARYLVNGKYIYFNFGFINMGFSVDATVVSLSLDGGPQESYKMVQAMGPSNLSRPGLVIGDCCAPVLPWN